MFQASRSAGINAVAAVEPATTPDVDAATVSGEKVQAGIDAVGSFYFAVGPGLSAEATGLGIYDIGYADGEIIGYGEGFVDGWNASGGTYPDFTGKQSGFDDMAAALNFTFSLDPPLPEDGTVTLSAIIGRITAAS